MRPFWQVVSSAFHASLFRPRMDIGHQEAVSHSDQFHKTERGKKKWLTIRKDKQTIWIIDGEKNVDRKVPETLLLEKNGLSNDSASLWPQTGWLSPIVKSLHLFCN